MKRFLKVLVTLSVIAALLLSFAACKDNEKSDEGSKEEVVETKSKKNKDTDKDEEEKEDKKADEDEEDKDDDDKDAEAATETVENFMNAACELNAEEAYEYTDSDEEPPYKDADDAVDQFVAEFSEGAPADGVVYFETLGDMMVDAMLDSMDYEITSCEKDGDEYVITVDWDCIDTVSIEDNMIVDESVGEEIAMELYENGDITEDMTEDEMVEVLMPATVEYMIEVLEDAIADADIKTETKEFVVYEDGGDWIIDADRSDIED